MGTAVETSHSGDEQQALRRLAREAGVQVAYDDAMGKRRVASTDALLAVLRALDLPLTRIDETADAYAALQEQRRQRVLPSNCVAWDGRQIRAMLHVDRSISPDDIAAAVHPNGAESSIRLDSVHVNSVDTHPPAPRRLIIRWSPARPIAFGIHPMTARVGTRELRTHVISAPSRCHHDGHPQRALGTFLPLYALQSERSLAVGDVNDLSTLAAAMASSGVDYIGTLPLLACFLDDPFDPSPYSPVSRLFWNELYADIHRAPQFEQCPAAQSILNAPETQQVIDDARGAHYVDYRAAARLKHTLIDALADTAFSDDQWRGQLERFTASNPEARRYATYRAAVHEFGGTWQRWSDEQERSAQRDDWSDDPRWRRHLYGQWLMTEQMQQLNDRMQSYGSGLYLDLPVGANDGGYDRWRFRDQFAENMNVGAPPDPFFTGGQNWGFSPLHPWHSAARQHEYFCDTLDAHCHYSSMLRIDHVMALHRLFWIPRGMDATEGVYVRYPQHELYAVLSLASHRHECRVVGENLGTVPPSVTRTMRRRSVLGMRVAQFEFDEHVDTAVPRPDDHALAALNTHDMPTFATFWHGDDIDQRVEFDLLTTDAAAEERQRRQRIRSAVTRWLQMRGAPLDEHSSTYDLMRAVTLALAESDAAVLMTNLEDFWLEPEPQNVPGMTDQQFPSWKRRAARSLESICSDRDVHALLQAIRQQRDAPRGSEMQFHSTTRSTNA